MTENRFMKYVTKAPASEPAKTNRFMKYVQNEPSRRNMFESGVDEGSFFEKTARDFQDRRENAQDIRQRAESGEISVPGAIARAGKPIAGLALDVVGNAVSEFIPTSLENAISGGISKIAETEPAQYVLNKVSNLRKQYPNASEIADSAANVALLAAPVRFSPIDRAASAIGKGAGSASKRLATAAAKQVDAKRSSFIRESLTPIQTDAIAQQNAITPGRIVEKGKFLKDKDIVPNARELEIHDEVSKIPKFNSRNSIQGNLNHLMVSISDEAEALKARLRVKNVPLDEYSVLQRISDTIDKMQKQEILLKGDAGKAAEPIYDKIVQLLDENIKSRGNLSAADLLEVRKDLDRFVSDQTKRVNGKDIFDDSRVTAANIANERLRRELNNIVGEAVPDARVKESLAKQNKLFEARDILKPKAAREGDNAILRLVNNISDKVKVKNTILKGLGAITGTSLIGVGAAFYPSVAAAAAGAAGVYGAKRAIQGPSAKKALSLLLKQADIAIKNGKDKDVIKQLRADRALLLDIIKDSNSPEKGGQN